MALVKSILLANPPRRCQASDTAAKTAKPVTANPKHPSKLTPTHQQNDSHHPKTAFLLHPKPFLTSQTGELSNHTVVLSDRGRTELPPFYIVFR